MNLILRIYFIPYKLFLAFVVIIYFFKIFKKDINYRKSKENIFSYFSTYFQNIIDFANDLWKRYVFVRHIFSLVFWLTICLIIYFFYLIK
jgi:hypothetical protein